MKLYDVEISKKARKQMKKLDRGTLILLNNWILKNLLDTTNPRQYGKALKGNLTGFWRYRIGDYRLIAKIKDEKLIIILIDLGHRKEIYK
ncbi:type II toxin-antitoxin system RelE family toxin [Oceanivirga salmonicida]|uniref:type II toxin-antitoxin system RelE family toxin n=1 Tax=Oceanivirga salmonicida TaxID=1769291 RepID=UPI0018CC7117|nr:type II toxin-antitoxin system RelE/ParE family toxin [Oceanivirga salmonicida]